MKVRDLYDVSNLGRLLAALDGDDAALHHKVILSYASLSASFPHGFEGRPARFAGMQAELEEQLYPMLRRGEGLPTMEGLVADAERFVSDWVLPQGEDERVYLERFASGEYVPRLLFDDDAIAASALASPEAQWKLLNLRRMRQ